MTLSLTDAEMAALDELTAKKDLNGPKIFRDSFKLYQAVERGAASVKWAESGPLGLPLRAQPQAREDAPPVAWRRRAPSNLYWTLFDNPKDAKFYLNCDAGGRYTVQPLYTHPAPDALRVAVEALEPFALLAPSEGVVGVNMDDPLSKWLTVADLVAASQARTAALQAEQKGGA